MILFLTFKSSDPGKSNSNGDWGLFGYQSFKISGGVAPRATHSRHHAEVSDEIEVKGRECSCAFKSLGRLCRDCARLGPKALEISCNGSVAFFKFTLLASTPTLQAN